MVAAKKSSEKKSLKQVIAESSKEFDTRIGGLGDDFPDVESMSTGNLAIDAIIGVGGLPLGRPIELYGPPSSGKTTLAMQALAQFQRIQKILKTGRKAAYFDFEHAVDKVYAAALGVDVDDILFVQPDFLEQGAKMCLRMTETGELGLCIFDSVAAMNPEALYDADVGKGQIALQARQMSDFLKKLVPLAHEHDLVPIFLNHIAEVIDTTPAGQRMNVKRYTTPGGRALKFYASVRIEFKQIGGVKGKMVDLLTNTEKEMMVATNVQVSVTKNKVAAPFGQAVVQVRYGRGFSQEFTVLQILVAHKVIRKDNGGIFRIPKALTAPSLEVSGTKDTQLEKNMAYIQGEAAVIHQLTMNRDFFDLCYKEAKRIADETKLRVSMEEILASVIMPEDATDDVDPAELDELLSP